jgi:multidrug transporter EmrE-like cation transporter
MSDSIIVKIQKRSPIKIHLLLLIFSILVQAFGAVCTKVAADIGPTATFLGFNAVLFIYCLILGGMSLQVFFWQASLKYYSLSFAYPFRSVVSFIVLFAAFFLFQESVSFFNIFGLMIISLGICYLVKDKEFLN